MVKTVTIEKHASALITNYRAICVCGWHKKTRGGRKEATRLLLQHLMNPATPAEVYEDTYEHEGCKLDAYLKSTYRWCVDHNVWVGGLPNEEESERLF